MRAPPITRPLLFVLGSLVALWPALALAHPGDLRTVPNDMTDAEVPWLQWDFHPSILIGILIFSALYTLGITVWRKKYALADKVEPRYPLCFYSAMILQWWALDGPLHYLSDERSFLAHMVQHLLLQTIWAPLLILGIPGWLLRPLVRWTAVQRLGRWMTRPRNAAIIFHGMVYGWHLPTMYDLALRHHPVHIAEHLLFMSTAVIFWWPLFSPIEEVPRARHGVQAVYLLLNLAPMKLLGLIIAVSNTLIYNFYATQPRVWGLTALGDQRLGGLVMWVLGGLPLWAALAWVWVRWRKEGTPRFGETGIPALDRKLAAQRPVVAPQNG